MLGPHKIIVDEWAEVWDLLKPYADGSFWQMPELDPANIYIIGRVLLKENWQTITYWATEHPGRVVFSNPAEGSETTGPKINITGYCNKFTPMGTVLSEGTGARSMAELVYKISGMSCTAAV